MAAVGVTLLENVAVTGGYKPFPGGRAVLSIVGTLATTTKLQALGPDGTTAIDVDATVSVGMTAYDLPAGSYRISLAGGSPAAIYAVLSTVPYY